MAEHALNERKFRELIKYIAAKSANDPGFGRTKLNKLLFYCDFLAYINLGAPITGDGYHKETYGPVPNHVRDILRRMKDEGEIVEAVTPFGGYEQHRPVTLQYPDLSPFNSMEIAWIDHVIEQIHDANAKQVSDLSHNFHGWQVAELGEEIPYESALVSYGEPTQEEIEHAKSLEGYAVECLVRR